MRSVAVGQRAILPPLRHPTGAIGLATGARAASGWTCRSRAQLLEDDSEGFDAFDGLGVSPEVEAAPGLSPVLVELDRELDDDPFRESVL